jgi:DNA-binding NarL/FixJ family response regulator
MFMGQMGGTAAVQRLFLVENMAIAEQAARHALQGSRFRIVAVAKSVSAVEAYLGSALAFDIALVDLRLDASTGIDAIIRLRQAQPNAPVICMSQLFDSENVQAALQAGAIGFIAKSDTVNLVRALDDALLSLSPLSPRAARSLVTSVQSSPPPNAALATLSKQEQQVLKLLGKARTYQDISGKLGLSLSTVQTYIKRLYKKLGVRTKAQATQIASQRQSDPTAKS